MSNQLFKQAKQHLHDWWGYNAFREGQQEAIQSVLNGRPTLVLFPTGGGKSLCYQLPATVFEGLTLVISPLIALMQDQVEQLNRQNINATYINSTLSRFETEQRLVNARNGMYKLLYCSPERLDTELWKNQLPELDISLVAIDEAHCISEWGHDFRPAYRKIYPALESLADSTRWIALTATATPEVRDDIITNLQFKNEKVVSTGFDRPNLKWWVTHSPKKKEKLLRGVYKASQKGGGIVYAGTRRNCEELAELLSQELEVKAAAYHAGMDSQRRSAIQQAWIADELSVVVATSAFGMGIDKADCRFVIHYQMPYSLEAYYQQAGRAGRDGEQSFPILLFKSSDLHRARERIKNTYPNEQQLTKTYDVLCDSLNLAVGSSQDEVQAIAIDQLKKRSNLSSSILRSSLKTLKNLDIIELKEHHIPKVGIKFEVNVEHLRAYISNEQNEQKSAFIDLLYRRLGQDAFKDFKYLTLKAIQQKLNVSRNGVIKGLQTLQNHDQLLRFQMQGEQPLVRIVEERVRALKIDKQTLQQGRKRLLKQLDYIKGYIETNECRERYLRRYFGEEVEEACGHCDNCLAQKSGTAQFAQQEIEKIEAVLQAHPSTIIELQKQLQWNRQKLKRVVRYLKREERIQTDGNKITLKP